MSAILPCKLNSAMSCSTSVSAFILDWIASMQLAARPFAAERRQPRGACLRIAGAEHEAALAPVRRRHERLIALLRAVEAQIQVRRVARRDVRLVSPIVTRESCPRRRTSSDTSGSRSCCARCRGKSKPRYKTQGAVGPVFGIGPAALVLTVREFSNACRSAGIARPSFGITACHTVMAGM